MRKPDERGRDPNGEVGSAAPHLPADIRPDHDASDSDRWLLRHPLPVRVTHWTNVLCLFILTISGFQIYTGRQWVGLGRWHHFFFAWIFAVNGFFFTGYALLSGHLLRDLLPGGKDLRGAGLALRNALLFRRPKGEEATRYGVLQKIAYTGVVFGLGPLILVTGLAMSARVDALFPVLLDLFGSRKRAAGIHFDLAIFFIVYTLVHLFMVAITGFWNNIRSMVTGWYRIPSSREDKEK